MKSLYITILALSVVLAFGLGYTVHPDTKIVENTAVVTVKGQRITLGPEDSLEYTIEHSKDIGPTTHTYTGSASASSAQMDAIGYNGIVGKSLMTFKTTPAEISIGGARGTLASVAYSASLMTNNGPLLIIIFGSLCVVGGIVCAIYFNKKLGIYVGIAGAVLIVIGLTFASFPWIGLLLMPLGIGGVIYFWLRAKKGKDKDITLTSIIGGIEKLSDEDKFSVTDAISAEAKATGKGEDGNKPLVKKVVTEVKKDIV